MLIVYRIINKNINGNPFELFDIGINKFKAIIETDKLTIVYDVVMYFVILYLTLKAFCKFIGYDKKQIYWIKKMNYVWILFCLVIIMMLLIVLNYDNSEIAIIIDFTAKDFLIEIIGVISLFVTYLSTRNDDALDNILKDDTNNIFKKLTKK